MKKTAMILIAILLMIMTMCSCSAFEKTETIPLTTNNISDYLVLEKTVSGGDVKSESSVLGFGFKDYEGEGDISIKATKIAEANFENVSVKVRIILSYGHSEKQWCFSSGGRFGIDGYEGACVKEIDMVISYDGVGEITESAYYAGASSANPISSPMNLSGASRFDIV